MRRRGWGRGRWRARPRWARWVGAAFVIGFLEGTGAHLLDLARGGIHAYAGFGPAPLQAFFVALVALDPLAAVLVARARPLGVRLAAGVMTLDVLANWSVNWPRLQRNPGMLLQPVGLLPITLFGLFVVGCALPLLRSLRDTDAVRGVTRRSDAAVLPPQR
ncbi:hypothetical protein [Streptomyces chattanoogensis]|uniref:Uncharacterized protein n=1 Tax=Streptomyces chattanoogensis TaxID=66876 RepID=A0A0N0XXC0_9ACTN|nr:hypothetical protein [Streptomyces chattanoogensis]KPC64545.1 hypothetical protein ADL29_11755 [Streptomyces chattanoogensis]